VKPCRWGSINARPNRDRDRTYVDFGPWWDDWRAAIFRLEEGMYRLIDRDQERTLKEDADDTTSLAFGLSNLSLEL